MRISSRTRLPAVTASVAALALLSTAAAAHIATTASDEAAVTPVERHRATAARVAKAPAEAGDLKNFEHVWNFQFPGGADQGTDIEFYTPTVPKRNHTTGALVLDAAGNQILEQRDFAIVGSYPAAGADRGAFVFDITNPEAPEFVELITCNQSQNDVQIKQLGDRWVLALARDGATNPCVSPRVGASGAAGIAVFDVSDPWEWKLDDGEQEPRYPERLFSFRTTGGAHNFTFHPTKPFGWVSTGDLPGGRNHIPVIDFTDLSNPRLAADIPVEGGPHDISFNTDGSRAYVASENNFRIYDSTNPANPVLISVSPSPSAYVHGADPTPDGKTLIVTDESLALGGFFAARTAVCPGGGITLFDISGANERRPVPLGYGLADFRAPSEDHRACTAHVGRISPNSKYYVTGWYRAGVRMFDISDPRQPKDIGHAMMPASEPWAAKFHKGDYVYTADLGRGFDVYRWTGPALGLPAVAAK